MYQAVVKFVGGIKREVRGTRGLLNVFDWQSPNSKVFSTLIIIPIEFSLWSSLVFGHGGVLETSLLLGMDIPLVVKSIFIIVEAENINS